MEIILVCCDIGAYVHFAERGVKFIKEHIRCVRLMLPKEIKRIPMRLIMELVYATNVMVNFIRRDVGVHPVMSSRHIVVGRRLVTPSYPPGSFIYGVPCAWKHI